MGVVRPSPQVVQVVLGPIADQVAGEIRAYVRAGAQARSGSTMEAATQSGAALAVPVDVEAVVSALGGRANLLSVEARASRLILSLADREAANLERVIAAGARDAAFTSSGTLHVVLAGDGASLAARIAPVVR
jgi:PTS system N-acetylglucosamine-specific IIC component